jgi:hypothetical protein
MAALPVAPYKKDNPPADPQSAQRYHDNELRKVQTAVQQLMAAVQQLQAATIDSSWTAFTPTLSAGTGTFTAATATGRYMQVGKLVFVRYDIQITTNGTAASSVVVSLPVNASATGTSVLPGREYALVGKMLQGMVTTTQVAIINYDNSYPGANGYKLSLTGVYEAA